MSEWYAEYLESPEWRLRARVMKDLAQETCESCGRQAVRPLHVHHISYHRIGDESPQDLVVLCEPCHEKTHNFPDAEHLEDLEFVAERHPAEFADYIVWEYRYNNGWEYDFVPEPREDRLPGEMES